MKQISAQQEVLINTGSQFAHRQWTEKDPDGSAQMNNIEKLEKACWDGLVKELIPELDITLDSDRHLWLWQIHETRSFLALNFYEYPVPTEVEMSIDPSLFMNQFGEN